MSSGGKRPGAGRPKGSTTINAEQREKFRQHSDDAIKAIMDIVANPEHSDRLKAASLVLDRGYGAASPYNPAESIIERFMSGEISAITAGLLFESEGLKVPELMQKYFDNELKIRQHKPGGYSFELNAKPEPLPTE